MTRFLGLALFLSALISCTTSKQSVATVDNGKFEKIDSIQKQADKRKTKEKVEDYFDPEYDKIQSTVYSKNIKTVQSQKAGWPITEQGMALGVDTLVFSFDELSNDLSNYYYTFIHCNADWTKSDLLQTEYLEGFFQDFINTYSFSFNTLTNFVHYEVKFPNKNVRPTKSGNYIFKVYRDNDPNDIVLTQRFIVFENLIQTEAKVVRPSIIDDRNDKQEVDFKINTGKLPINDSYNDLQVVLLQNHRWDNAITDLKPRYIRGTEFDYNYDKENVFDGLNEFRFLDLKSLRYRGPSVKEIKVIERKNYVQLFPAKDRRFKNYISYIDVNGKYIIKTQEGVNNNLEADYALVTFYMESKEKLTGDVYVFGGLTNHQFKDEFKLTYNSNYNVYEGSILLKQGFYDYYFALKTPNGAVDIPYFEGNHFETVNNYTVITYLRDQIADYDRIVGYFSFGSDKQN